MDGIMHGHEQYTRFTELVDKYSLEMMDDETWRMHVQVRLGNISYHKATHISRLELLRLDYSEELLERLFKMMLKETYDKMMLEILGEEDEDVREQMGGNYYYKGRDNC